MIIFPVATHQLWPSFSLRIENPLEFKQNQVYHLTGPNGSGKSSFISQLLIPALQKEKAYLLHFEQQASLQLQAVRAWAAIFSPQKKISCITDMQDFLLQDLQQNHQKHPLAVWIVADEITQLSRLQELRLPGSLIFCAHHQGFEHARKIIFEVVDASLSKVYHAQA